MTPAWAWSWGKADTRRLRTRDVPGVVMELVDRRLGGRYCVACRQQGLTPPPGISLEVDHLQPLSKGGTNHHSNLTWACSSHNRGRGNRREYPAEPAWNRGAKP